MKPVIGIVSSLNKSYNITVNDACVLAIEKSGGEPIVLVTKKDDVIGDNILNICDGFLFQGGYKMEDYQLKILEYANKNKKPILGICLGHQLIATYFEGFGCISRISDIDCERDINHNPSESIEDKSFLAHKIYIDKNSYMYNMFGPEINVNSRHIKAVTKVNKPFIISAKAEDGIIEAIEYIDQDNYIVGMQFHPEDIAELKPVFDNFIERIKQNKKSK